MAIGKRIKHIRVLRGFTQKELGNAIGFGDKTADVRIAQYESETRIPKEDLLAKIAETLNVSPGALSVPEIDSYTGVMQTLFTLEDTYGLKINEIDGELCLTLDKEFRSTYVSMLDMLTDWQRESARLKNGKITKQDYDDWRYNYPASQSKRFKEIRQQNIDKHSKDK